ncbi:VCBS repeat-containing protein [Planktothrix agardhii 1807]|uniref:FG-GAP repeat domain-containing protein n=1 Tax=Planktothrix agardhii TaxID=1160 RepID=UPI001F3AB1B5|nr:VCBS repeat-containing protein [Planktothrix agardhii]MCF3569173.1 VCBS repeat-containing protein [Planktothrix agardhii 1807]
MENNQKAFNLPFSENLPIILIGNLSVEPLRAAGIIEEALTQVKDKLTEFIASPTLATDLQTVFTPGDEGELLAALVQGDGLSASEIARLRSETDQVVVTLEDQTVILEASGPSFTEDTSISLPGVVYSSVAWADYNGDGKQDFLLTGKDNSGYYISKLYKNTGSGFSEDTSVSLPGVGWSSVAWADYNGDGKPDFLLTGFGSFGRISKLYKNTGSGFTEDTSVSLPGVDAGSVAWADYNGDGKQDFLLTGFDSYSSETISNKISKLYKNTGSGFIEDTSVSLLTTMGTVKKTSC